MKRPAPSLEGLRTSERQTNLPGSSNDSFAPYPRAWHRPLAMPKLIPGHCYQTKMAIKATLLRRPVTPGRPAIVEETMSLPVGSVVRLHEQIHARDGGYSVWHFECLGPASAFNSAERNENGVWIALCDMVPEEMALLSGGLTRLE